MPRAILSLARVEAMAGRSVPPDGWAEALFPTKAEFAGLTPPDALAIESTPDRLDLLCEAGLGGALAGRLGSGAGAPRVRPGPPTGVGEIRAAANVAPLRPEIAAVELTAPAGAPLDASLLSELIRFQELLHATVGLDRRLASFGLYAVDRIRGPVEYRAVDPGSVRFVPLEGTEPTDGARFYREHPMTARYGVWGAGPAGVLVLRDADGAVLSLPPVLNAEGPGSVRPGDGRILLESTGTRRARVVDGIGLLLLPFVARGWQVSPVPVLREGSPVPETPVPGPIRSLELRAARLAAVAGAEVPAVEVDDALRGARLDARRTEAGWAVEVPPWRPDLLQEVDLIEEVVVARGVRLEEGRLLPSATRGHRRPESRFRDDVAESLMGAGFVPLHTPLLVATARNDRIGRSRALRLANPVSEEHAVVRDRLLPSLLMALGRNVRHAYPQRLSEVGPVVEPDPSAEAGGRTVWRAAFVLAGEGLGFAEAAARLDALLRSYGARGVREPAALPGAIPGRAATLRIAGEAVGEIGEVHPAQLEAERIPVPVAFAEVDLSALWPLVRPSGPHETS